MELFLLSYSKGIYQIVPGSIFPHNLVLRPVIVGAGESNRLVKLTPSGADGSIRSLLQ